MKAGVSLYSFHGYKNSDLLGTKGCIEKAKELGFSGLDFIEFGNFSSRAEYISYASDIGSFCKDIGMEAVCFCVGADFINNSAKEETDRVKFLAEVAANLGCIYMRHDATRGPKNGDRSDESFENVLPALAEAYAEVTRYAKELGVKTCIENHGFFVQEAKRVKSIIDAVGDDNFGALIDIGNFMCADKEPTEEMKILTPHVFHAHAKDFHFRDGTLGAPEKGYFKTLAGNYLCGAILGQGCVDVEKCTNILKESGYDGYITLEFEGMEDPLLAIEMGKNDLSNIYETKRSCKAMTRYILLTNARIINVAEKSLCDSDILIRQKDAQSDSEIVAVGSDISLPDTSDSMIKTLDLHGQFVCPSFTDMRCDICEPGNRNREDLESLGAAASLGGFGAVCSIPIDGIDASDQTVLDYIFENEHRTDGIKILPCVNLASSDGKINDIESLAKGGAVAFYDDGRASLPVLKKAMEICAKNGLLVIVHCQENALVGDGVMNEGNTSKMLGLNGISASCEEIAVAKNLLLAAETDCRLHISHVSTARSVEMIRKAKADGVRVSCDTSVQYFALSDSDIPFYSSNAKVMPPLRTEKDRVAITEAIKDGTIDCICSDHSPKTVREKPNDLEKALPGMIGLQTAFTVSLDRLVMGGHIDLFRLVELFTSSCEPIIGFGHDIKVGEKAYLNVFSLEADTFFQSENSRSKSKNSPFLETGFRGCLTYTVTNGVLNTNPDISVF